MTANIDILDKSRSCWGRVFSEFQNARELVNAARYHVKDQQALKQEDIQRLQSLINNAQKEIDAWETK